MVKVHTTQYINLWEIPDHEEQVTDMFHHYYEGEQVGEDFTFEDLLEWYEHNEEYENVEVIKDFMFEFSIQPHVQIRMNSR